MNRQIKFRAWDKERGSMVDGIEVTDFVSPELQQQLNKGVIELMQYTGLKDKNGKEIYEGDIVKCHIFVQELGENYGVVEGEREFVGKVSFGITGFNVEANSFRDNPVFYDEFHEESLEVTGNIMENPGLLK